MLMLAHAHLPSRIVAKLPKGRIHLLGLGPHPRFPVLSWDSRKGFVDHVPGCNGDQIGRDGDRLVHVVRRVQLATKNTYQD
jgi:hypothetical protein